MSAQNEALRMADRLEGRWALHPEMQEAAAELRRLKAENDRLHQINQSHEMKLSVRGYEIQIADLKAQRDALLEALKELTGHINERFSGGVWDRARAAIKAVEGEKT